MKQWITWVRAASTKTQDTILAAVLCLVDLVLLSDLPAPSTNPLDPTVPRALLIVYAAAGYSALRWRRQAPIQVFIIMWLHSMVAMQIMVYRPMVGLLAALYPGFRSWWSHVGLNSGSDLGERVKGRRGSCVYAAAAVGEGAQAGSNAETRGGGSMESAW
jgi:hypothetical protein